MEIKTKFNLGDIVVPIQDRAVPKKVTCETCSGKGVVPVVVPNDPDRTVGCPDCYRKGYETKWSTSGWSVNEALKSAIGKIDVQLYWEKEGRPDQYQYMIESTGIGSGQVWDEKDLFSTIEEAQAECDRRNAEA